MVLLNKLSPIENEYEEIRNMCQDWIEDNICPNSAWDLGEGMPRLVWLKSGSGKKLSRNRKQLEILSQYINKKYGRKVTTIKQLKDDYCLKLSEKKNKVVLD